MSASRSRNVARGAAVQRLAVVHARPAAGCSVDVLRDAATLTDPYVAIEHFRLSQPVFGPHPHAGFSAVTYLFEDSASALVSRDSLGGDWRIEPGGLHWLVAGRGLVHEEIPARPGLAAHGLRMHVNLPATQKRRAPAVLRLCGDRMPQRHGPGWREVQVFGHPAPLALPVLAALRIVHVEPAADYLPDASEPGFGWLISGHGRLGTEALGAGEVWPLDAAAALTAGSALVLAVFSGRPLRETVVEHGPFVMNTEAEIVAAMQSFQCGEMGRLGAAAPPPAAEPPQET